MTDWKDGPWDINDDTYYGDNAHVSHSMLDTFRESIPTYHATHVACTLAKPKPTPQMQFGTLFHQSLFDEKGYAREAPARKDALLIEAMRLAVTSHEIARDLIKADGHTEIVYRWRDKRTGIPCKAKADRVTGRGLVVDVKTASDPTPLAFAKACANYGYHRQAAHYLMGGRQCFGEAGPFIFVVVGKSEPHEVICYELSGEFLELGLRQNETALDQLAKCLDSGKWGSRWPDVQTLEAPRYALYEL